MDVSVPRRVQIVNTDDNKDQNEQIKVTAEQLREERAKLLARCFSLSCIFRVVRSAT